jgi:uncharacterized protein
LVSSMKFDSFTVALLFLRSDAPKLSEDDENRLQDAHMDYLAKLHEEGHLLAAGPILGSADRKLRGLSIFRGSPEEARRLADRDPGVLEGRYMHEFFPWIVPGGAMSFSHTRFPRSMSEVQ